MRRLCRFWTMRQSTFTTSSIDGTMTRELWLCMCLVSQPDVWALGVWLPCFALTCTLLSALVAESDVCHRPGTASDMLSLAADIPTCTSVGTPPSGRQTLPSQLKPGFPGKRSQLKVCPAVAACTQASARRHAHWLQTSSVAHLWHLVVLAALIALLCCAAARASCLKQGYRTRIGNGQGLCCCMPHSCWDPPIKCLVPPAASTSHYILLCSGQLQTCS